MSKRYAVIGSDGAPETYDESRPDGEKFQPITGDDFDDVVVQLRVYLIDEFEFEDSEDYPTDFSPGSMIEAGWEDGAYVMIIDTHDSAYTVPLEKLAQIEILAKEIRADIKVNAPNGRLPGIDAMFTSIAEGTGWLPSHC